MILHCWYCSLGGERLSEDSKVATVDEQRLQRPVTPDMFGPLNGTGAPFMEGVEWRYMKHMACGKYPWPQAAVVPGDGPLKILTDKGFVDVPDKFECEVCGWVGKTGPALKCHMTLKHTEEPNG